VNILIVSSRSPVPVHRGDQVLLFHRIRELTRRGHKISLCFAHLSRKDADGLGDLEAMGVAVYPYRLPAARRVLNLLTRGASGLPLQVELFRDRGFRSLVAQVVERERVDLINAFLIRPFLAVDDQRVPVIVDLVDSMQLNARRRIALAPAWLRPVLRVEASRLSRFEPRVCARAAASLVVARADREVIGGERIHVNPLGVDATEFHPGQGGRVPRRVVFTGNMGYHANQVAVEWFMSRCWPGLRREFPDAELVVAGRGSGALAASHPNVEGVRFAGEVASMGDLLRTAEVSVAPMQSGSGMQFKVLEAMACGVPTVVTPLGVGDIQAVHRRHTLVAEGEVAFAEAVRTLFGDPSLRAAVGQAGAELVASQHSWARNAEEFERIAEASLKGSLYP
jgi:glycosyltransferase involved in cell wall biosynthesis